MFYAFPNARLDGIPVSFETAKLDLKCNFLMHSQNVLGELPEIS
jgi:hypothetical protein